MKLLLSLGKAMQKPMRRVSLLIVGVLLSGCAHTEMPSLYCKGAAFGAAPPDILSTDQLAQVKALLAPYKADVLTAEQARAIQLALEHSGLQRSPALNMALDSLGFSAKRLDELAPCPPQLSTEPVPQGSGRPVPRPQ